MAESFEENLAKQIGEDGDVLLARSIAIVMLMNEKGLLKELLEENKLTVEEIDARATQIQKGFGEFKEWAEGQKEE